MYIYIHTYIYTYIGFRVPGFEVRVSPASQPPTPAGQTPPVWECWYTYVDVYTCVDVCTRYHACMCIFGGSASRQRSLNSLFQLALHLP